MKKIIDGVRYDSEKGKKIAEKSHYNNGNYSGSTYLMESPTGKLFFCTDSNGQDCYLSDDIWTTEDINIDGMTVVNEELAIKYGLFKDA